MNRHRFVTLAAVVLVAFALLDSTRSEAQIVRTSLTLEMEPLYRTNSYLDPVIPVWDTASPDLLISFAPSVYADISGAAGYASVYGNLRTNNYFGSARDRSGLTLHLTAQRRVIDWLLLGISTTHVRISPAHRTTGWMVSPYKRSRIGRSISSTVRVGISGITQSALPAETPQSFRSIFVSAGLQYQVSGSAELQSDVYYGRPETSASLPLDHGLGLSAGISLQADAGTRLSFDAGLEQFRFASFTDTGGNRIEPHTSKFFRANAKAEWPLASLLTLLGSVRYLRPLGERLQTNPNDLYMGAGLRLSLNRTFPTKRSGGDDWWSSEGQVQRIKVNYDGTGRLYILGDFNHWEKDAVELVEGPGNVYTATLMLEPGTYQYKIQIREGDEIRWLPFPSSVYTVSDGFGGVNGHFIVPAN